MSDLSTVRVVATAAATGAAVAVLLNEVLRRVLRPQITEVLPKSPAPPAALSRKNTPQIISRRSTPEALPPALAHQASIERHADDSVLRALNLHLMQRGHAATARAAVAMYAPEKTKVVRIAAQGKEATGGR